MIDAISATAASGGVAKTKPTEILSGGLGNFAADLQKAESTSAAGLLGQAGPREVAETVMQAERSLQTAVAVRDKIVSAFLEISRMAI